MGWIAKWYCVNERVQRILQRVKHQVVFVLSKEEIIKSCRGCRNRQTPPWHLIFLHPVWLRVANTGGSWSSIRYTEQSQLPYKKRKRGDHSGPSIDKKQLQSQPVTYRLFVQLFPRHQSQRKITFNRLTKQPLANPFVGCFIGKGALDEDILFESEDYRISILCLRSQEIGAYAS